MAADGNGTVTISSSEPSTHSNSHDTPTLMNTSNDNMVTTGDHTNTSINAASSSASSTSAAATAAAAAAAAAAVAVARATINAAPTPVALAGAVRPNMRVRYEALKRKFQDLQAVRHYYDNI